ncbi:MAG: formate--phosphoribosylaminoimidazolecarboxamide ligase family protein [Candidatus Bathyarchaeota archaeon]|uniref:formate--phosphoribosylaminoimidazolecarboxamide ligase family protein n=1 Tax=Candidatus Bathycorpusculum sp. TaxID=2994959 RepID=UPI0028301BC3|nr:formate--phosphoribosylaminoimidazolecarboxamide ligase family protein [Candidatus Termiticorpusculum sp.]MCL2258157.1 formate--phosphoribosylaminoimidazolecarboxamide ligase family protein [Candidatus Termiticorpusculum sp.]MCL2291537.1 formate--phosphoribosylaminoimidazolecarboxamide ligase family protein [Candidatus Termiticorpusculum sp.]
MNSNSSMQKRVNQVIADYKPENVHIGVLGSHSALEIAAGAKQEGFKTVVVCQKGREKTYTHYYRNIFDKVIFLDHFQDITKPETVKALVELDTVFVPNRSFSVYAGYEAVEQKFAVPLMGNRYLLKTEERTAPKNQLWLLKEAGIELPQGIKTPKDINCPAIIKVPEKERSIERAFFYASNYTEYQKEAEKRLKAGIITKEALNQAVIEEYVIGAKFNANYFYSPLNKEIDLLGFDRRIQTDLDGVLDMPAQEQLELKIPTQNIEIGHQGVTMRESQLEKIFEAAEKFVAICHKEYPPGMIGLFALQGAVTKDLEFRVFDVSPRVPGCPCVEPTSPYMKYKYGVEVGPGKRVAMEIKRALRKNRLSEVVT